MHRISCKTSMNQSSWQALSKARKEGNVEVTELGSRMKLLRGTRAKHRQREAAQNCSLVLQGTGPMEAIAGAAPKSRGHRKGGRRPSGAAPGQEAQHPTRFQPIGL